MAASVSTRGLPRHYKRSGDSDNYGALWASARRGKLNVVFWTWQRHRILRSQAQYARLKRVWKRWYERQGWTVRGEIATSPDGERHAIGLRVIPVERIKEINGV